MATEKKDWKKLNAFQHARLRNEMYFGSRDPHVQTVLEYVDGKPVATETTWIPAVFTAIREVIDNALDEMMSKGFGDRLDVTFDASTMLVTVQDNGRGIPIDYDKSEKAHAATVLMSNTMAGRNFEERGNERGMNGIGASVTNFVSEYFILDITRDGQHFNQRFSEGKGEKLSIESPIITPTDAKTTGTKVTFKLSNKVFPKLFLPESFMRSRMIEIALAYPKLKVFYNGDRVVTSTVEKTFFADAKPITFTVKEPGFISQFWLMPNFFSDGSEMSHGLVNAIPTFNGGTHIDAFRRHFFSGLLDALAPMSKKRRLTPNRSDIADGLLVFNLTEMDGATFDSQNKVRMINEPCAAHVRKALDDPEFFKRVLKNYPEWIESIYARCAERTQKKDSAEIAKLAKKNLRMKVEDLEDASGRDRQKCTLFLGEGKSAISGIVDARDADLHGGLPLRGKVLNVHGKTLKQIWDNEALRKIMQAIGLEPGVRPNRYMLRYGRVNITTDADEDGKNIAALLVNFFFTLWPDLFKDPEKPFLYVFETPLIIAVKGKQRKYWYNENYADFEPESYKGWDITRAKGLAALKREDWKYVLANPKTMPIVDDGKLREVLDLWFDETKADLRKADIGM